MPARKSNVSAGSNEDATPAKSAAASDDGLSVEDLNLPRSIVQRLAKGVLPPNTQIQKDALLAMSKSATVFVNYLTSCAAEQAQSNGKRTVMPADVFAALNTLEFEAMIPRLEAETAKFQSILADKRTTYRKKVKEEEKAKKAASETVDDQHVGRNVDDGERAAKRTKMDGVEAEDDGSADEVDGDETIDVEDEEVEDDEIEEEVVEEGLAEDPLEEREDKDDDDEMADGDESD